MDFRKSEPLFLVILGGAIDKTILRKSISNETRGFRFYPTRNIRQQNLSLFYQEEVEFQKTRRD